MEKYNKFVEAFVAGEAEYDRVSEEAIVKAKEASHKAFESFTKEMESKVADWTREDLDKFIKFSKEDDRIDAKGATLVMEMYRKTHRGQKDNVPIDGIILALVLMDVLDVLSE